MTSEPNNNDLEIPVLLSIDEFSKKHKFLKPKQIRWMLFRDDPGLEECLVRISNRIYIKEKDFFAFLLKNEKKKPQNNQ